MAMDQLQLKKTQTSIRNNLGKRALDVVIDKNDIRVIVAERDTNYRKKLLVEIAKSLGTTYNSIGDRSGAVSIKGSKIFVKPGVVTQAGAAKTPPMLKPSNIKPSIVGVWLDAATMSRNVQKYIQDQKEFDTAEKKAIIDLVKLVSRDNSTSFKLPGFPRNLVPSEFFEVLSSIKLSKLMSVNDPKIREVLGIPKKLDLSKVKIKINIPIQANMPLLDYWININNTSDESTSIKISVKSKVSSPKTNTVKFQDTFANSSPDRWYADLPRNIKSIQEAQKIIAKAVIDSYKIAGVATRNTQIVPLLRLLQSSKKAEISNILKDRGITGANINTLIGMLETLLKLTSKQGSTKLTELLKGPQLKLAQTMVSELSTDSADSFAAVLYVFDSIVQESSRKTSSTKYNFYTMFYDEVLKRQSLAFAVSNYKGDTLNLNFYTKVNWAEELGNYVALRIQSSTKGINSSIGLDV